MSAVTKTELRSGVTRTILKYPGSKGSMAKSIIALMPAHRLYAEPFGGSAAVLLNKSPAPVEWYNDTFDEVVNLFQIIRQGGEQLSDLVRLIEATPFARGELLRSREQRAGDSPVERTRQFLVRSWFGWGGSLSNQTTGFRTSKGDTRRLHAWNSLGDRLLAAAERFKNVQIERLDATKFILVLDTEDSLFYVDPPYIEETLNFRERQVYHQKFLLNDHENLLCCLSNLKGRFILSGYPHPMYDDMAVRCGWQVVDVQHTTQRHSTKTERLYLNFQ